jgi:PAS domain S-box-containing protein
MSETTAQPIPPSDGKHSLRVLVVEDSEFDARMLIGLLRAGGFEPEFERVETEGGMRAALGQAQWEVILADYNLPDFSAPRALEVLKESQLDIPFIIVSGGIGEDTAVAAMKSGAHDYLMKGNLARLVPAVERELREAAVRSSRRQTVKDLRASELRHRSLIENTSDIIAVLDCKGMIQFVSPACERVLGASAEALIDSDWFALAHGEDRDRLKAEFGQALGHEGKQFSIKGRFAAADGSERVMDIKASNLLADEAIAGVVINERLKEQAVMHESEEQFRVASEIQQHLFPWKAPQLDGFDIAGASRPAAATGGDYFDYLTTSDSQLALAIGDVSGHGIGPAMLMAETRAYLRILTRNRNDLSLILTRANTMMGEDVGEDRFVTMLLVKLDPEKRTLVYASAGHSPAFILGSDGAVKSELRRTGMPLGVMRDAKYTVSKPVCLAKGDVLVLLTDGLEEAANPEGELFGVGRILEAVHKSRQSKAAKIVESVFETMKDFSGNAEQVDDLTMIIAKAE